MLVSVIGPGEIIIDGENGEIIDIKKWDWIKPARFNVDGYRLRKKKELPERVELEEIGYWTANNLYNYANGETADPNHPELWSNSIHPELDIRIRRMLMRNYMCRFCGASIVEYEGVMTGKDGWACRWCLEDSDYLACKTCGNYYNPGDLRQHNPDKQDGYVCFSCDVADKEGKPPSVYSTCVLCDAQVNEESGADSGQDGWICNLCLGKSGYYACQTCGQYHHVDYCQPTKSGNDTYLCRTCFNAVNTRTEPI